MRRPRPRRLRAALLAGVLAGTLAGTHAGCRREEPAAGVGLTPRGTAGVVRTSSLQAGPPAPDPEARDPYEGDANALADGRAAFMSFNCAGCHGRLGGGGIGPPFADTEWIYGDAPENIYQTIAQGRPNGMPAFGSLVDETTLWKLVAYVRSLGPRGETSGAGGGVTSGGSFGGRQPTAGGRE